MGWKKTTPGSELIAAELTQSAMSRPRPLGLPILLTSLLLIFSTLGLILMLNIKKNEPASLLVKALDQTFLSDDTAGWTVYGDSYVQTKDGGLYGASLNGQLTSSGDFKIDLDTGYLISGSRLELVKPSNTDSVYGKLSGLKDITGVFAVGGANLDSNLSKLIRYHRDDIDSSWYKLSDKSELSAMFNRSGLASLGSLSQLKGGMREAAAQAYLQYPFLEIDHVYYGEVLSNSVTAQYRISINQTKFKNFLNKLKSKSDLSQSTANQLIKSASHISGLQIWVNLNSHKVEQVRFAYDTAKDNYTLRLRFADAQSTANFEKPKKAEPVQNLLDMLDLGD